MKVNTMFDINGEEMMKTTENAKRLKQQWIREAERDGN